MAIDLVVAPGETAAAVQAAVPEGGSQPVTPATPTIDWKSQIPEEYKTEKEWETYKDLGGVLKSHINLVKRLGTSIKIPDKDAGPEEVAAFRAKLGVPESADKYDVKLPAPPEGKTVDDSLLKAMLPVFHKAGLSNAQAQEIADAYTKMEAERSVLSEAAAARMDEENLEEVRKLWGATTEYNLGLGKLAQNSKYFAHPLIKEFLEIPGVASHPGMVVLRALIGRDLPEARYVEGGQAPMGLTPESAKAEAEKLMADPANGYYQRDHPKYRQTRERVRMLFDIHSGGAMHRMD